MAGLLIFLRPASSPRKGKSIGAWRNFFETLQLPGKKSGAYFACRDDQGGPVESPQGFGFSRGLSTGPLLF
jgi:hypothetical protein